ncbi:protein GET4 isoform X2 [Rhodamnia argentea]|uniref:Protein GET4 isoform X2 n=1 Tax=Rhodamnia argentea TaxID=178133 RepID=A0ABM3HE63_9MYRT|nr:protein GET4 isoform X2 [Rhodamnia argentea]
MSRERPKRSSLPPAQENIEKLEKVVSEGNFYGAQQMYKTVSARYIAAERYAEALDILESGACLQLQNGQITCGAELAALFVEALVKGNYACDDQTLDRVSNIYKKFPQMTIPEHLGDDDDVQQLAEALGAAKTRVECCSSFLKAALKWSSQFGPHRAGSPELHSMLAEYIYSESPEVDMAKVSFHFVRGNNPKKFASTLVNFMGKCYPSEDDLAIARGILILQRDALPLFNMLKASYKPSIDRDPAFHEFLDLIAERFYGVQRRNPLQGMFGDIFKMMGGE